MKKNPPVRGAPKSKVSIPLAFLVGVPRDKLPFPPEKQKIERDEDCAILRTLSSLRSAVMQNYDLISSQIKEQVAISDISCLSRLVGVLKEQGISVVGNSTIGILISLNQLISDKAPVVCKKIFPEDISERLSELFIMPKGETPMGVKVAMRGYRVRKNFFPYQKWISWDFDKSGRGEYIFGNDKDFLGYLKEQDKIQTECQILQDFLSKGEAPVVIIDSENSDPEKAFALLSEYGKQVKRIVVVLDSHSSSLWKNFTEGLGTPVECQKSERLKEQKSLVDFDVTIRISDEYHAGNKRFLLFSSDSDIWSIIRSYPDAEFLLMVEQEKLGDHLSSALAENGIPKCCIDEYGKEGKLMTEAVISEGIKLLHKSAISLPKLIVHAASNVGVYIDSTQISHLAERLAEHCVPVLNGDTVVLTETIEE